MKLEVDFFSGRHNPAWGLSLAEEKSIQTALGELEPCPEKTLPDRLGYRGFIVSDEATHSRVIICGGCVWHYTFRGLSCFQDQGRLVERILLGFAQIRLPPEEFQHLATQADLGTP